MDQRKAAIFNHRMDQFLWGWCWAGVMVQGFKLVGLEPTEQSPWTTLFFFVLLALLGLYFGRKVMAVGYSFKEE